MRKVRTTIVYGAKTWRGVALAVCVFAGHNDASAQAPPKGLSPQDIAQRIEMQTAPKSKATTVTGEGIALECRLQRLKVFVTQDGGRFESTAETEGQGEFMIRPTVLCRVTDSGEVRSGSQTVISRVGRLIKRQEEVLVDRGILAEVFKAPGSSLDQEFVVKTRPNGSGRLGLVLKVEGATASPLARGVRLVLDSGRALHFGTYAALSADNKELTATVTCRSPYEMMILVEDEKADYPIVIR